MQNIKIIDYFILLLLIPLLFGCREAAKESPENVITPGGKLTIIINDPVETLDPKNIIFKSDWQASFLIYEGLVGYSDSLNKLEPLLAGHWEILEDGKLIRFYLRENIRFHDDPCFPGGKGRRVTAEDVVYMLERLASPINPSYYYGLFSNTVTGIDEFHAGNVEAIEGIKVIDDRTVVFHMKEPIAAFLKLLATPAAYIIPQEAVNYYGDMYYRHPVGTGPFRLAVWKPIEELIFVKNRNYWAEDSLGNALPYLDEITMRIRAEGVSPELEFLKEQIHILIADKNKLENLLSAPGFADKVGVYESTMNLGVRFYGIRLNSGSILAEQKLLRKAIAMSFDRDFLESDPRGLSAKSGSFVPEELLLFPGLHYYPVNHTAAQEIISELNLQNETIKLASSIYCHDLEQLEQAMSRLGVAVEIDVQPLNYYRYVVSGEPDIFRVSMIPSFPDPIDYYSLFYSKSPPDLNLMGYKNPEFDAVFEQSMVEQDEHKRNKLFLHLERIIYDDVPVLLLSHNKPGYYVLPAYVNGFTFRYIYPDYRKIWFADADVRENKN